jgi:hypothetical protein
MTCRAFFVLTALADGSRHGYVSLAELLILVAAVALVAPNVARAQTATPAPPPYRHTMAA